MKIARLALILSAIAAAAFTLWTASAGRVDVATEETLVVQRPVSAAVIAEVMSYVEDWRANDDPLISLASGAQVKTSAVQGVMVDGRVYFYSLRPHQSFDPWTRGEVADSRIVVVAKVGEHTPSPVIIYQLK